MGCGWGVGEGVGVRVGEGVGVGLGLVGRVASCWIVFFFCLFIWLGHWESGTGTGGLVSGR